MKLLQLVLTGTAIFLIHSCNKPEVVPPPTPDGAALTNLINSYLDSKMEYFTVDATSGGVVYGAGGTRIIIYPNSLYDQSNNLVTGNVNIEFVEIYTRGNMALANKPTMGLMSNGDHGTLVSGGEYYLNITQNGNQLHTNSYVQVDFPVDLTGGADYTMQLFKGGMELENNDLLWELDQNDSVNVVADTTFGVSYQILDGSWGWTNVDRFYSDPSPKTTLLVELPDGYDNTNSEVFITYDGEPTALARMDVFTSDGYFSEHYGQIPIGLNIHVIAVAMVNDELNYKIKAATIVEGGIISITSFETTTQTALANLINDLP